jgi:protocatechuate 3,4-dioxygenase beta subunit
MPDRHDLDRHDHVDDHDGGLAVDLSNILARRRALTLLAGAAVVGLVGCGPDDDDSDSASSSSSSTSTTEGSSTSSSAAAGGTCDPIPEETAGPYPGDGSNGPDVLAESGVVRSDITSSFGSASGVAEGVPTTVTLTIVDDSNSCAPLSGAALYLWHCTREGEYSMYGQGIEDENYLRGVQESGSDGTVTFTTIFPACYSGRWPHMHFEVYPSVDDATAASNRLRTSQLALPQDVCEDVYGNADGYSASMDNLSQVSLDTDMVFSDGYELQMATVSGSIDDGYTVTLQVAVTPS